MKNWSEYKTGEMVKVNDSAWPEKLIGLVGTVRSTDGGSVYTFFPDRVDKDPSDDPDWEPGVWPMNHREIDPYEEAPDAQS